MSNLSLFSEKWYLEQYPDVSAAVAAGLTNAEQHFQQFGNAEGRPPGPLFNIQQYLVANPDVAAAVEAGAISPYDHLMHYGAMENRTPLSAFDIGFYLAQNPDVAAAVNNGIMSTVQHFLLHGREEIRSIMLGIDLASYLEANPDIRAAVQVGQGSPLDHLLAHGMSEGRNLGNGVDLSEFGNDPTFMNALASGNLDAAMGRVSAVAPFLPDFERPPGWTPPANLPIPVDFVPAEGTRLVIPPEVNVPDGLELPDTFVPVEPPPPPPPGTGGGGGGGGMKTLTVDGDAHYLASELHNVIVKGSGSVTIDGSDGKQTLRIGTTGSNDISGGLDADDIRLGMGTGTDIIRIDAQAPTLVTGTSTAIEGGRLQLEVDLTNLDTANGSGFIHFRLDGASSSTLYRYSNQSLDGIVAALNADTGYSAQVVASAGAAGTLILTSKEAATSLTGGTTDITAAFSDSAHGLDYRDLIRNFELGRDTLVLPNSAESGLTTTFLTLDDIAPKYKGIGPDVGDSWIQGIVDGMVSFGGALARVSGGQQADKVAFLMEAVGSSKGVLAFNDRESSGPNQGRDLAIVLQFDGISSSPTFPSTAGDSLIAFVGDPAQNTAGFWIGNLQTLFDPAASQPRTDTVDDAQTFTAAALHNVTVTGLGSVTVTGSLGLQTLHITTTGANDITGGQGSDTIILGEGIGSDTIHVNARAPLLIPGELSSAGGQLTLSPDGTGTGVIYFRQTGDTSSTTYRYSGMTLEEIVSALNADDAFNSRVTASQDGGNLVLTTVSESFTVGGITDITDAFSDSYPGYQHRDLIRNFDIGTDRLALSDGGDSGLSTALLTLDQLRPEYTAVNAGVRGSWIESIENGVVTFGGMLGGTTGGNQSEKVVFLYEAVGGSKGVLAFNDRESGGEHMGRDLAVVMQFDGISGSTAVDSLVAFMGDLAAGAPGFMIDDLGAILQPAPV